MKWLDRLQSLLLAGLWVASVALYFLERFDIAYLTAISLATAFTIHSTAQAAVIRTLQESNEERSRLLDDAHNMAERSINGVSTYLWKSGETLALIRDVLDDHGAAAARDLMTVQIEYIRQNIKPPNWTENVEDIVKNLEEQ